MQRIGASLEGAPKTPLEADRCRGNRENYVSTCQRLPVVWEVLPTSLSMIAAAVPVAYIDTAQSVQPPIAAAGQLKHAVIRLRVK